jgi:hypothetical protein
MRGWGLAALCAAAGLALLPAGAQGAAGGWYRCRGGDGAADAAGFARLLDRNDLLRRVAYEHRDHPSLNLVVEQSLCGDLDADGRLDRAVAYAWKGGTGSSPGAAVLLLGRRGGPPRIGWRRIGVVLASDFRVDGARALHVDEALYGPRDPNCCPSRLRTVRLSAGRGGPLRVRVSTHPSRRG